MIEFFEAMQFWHWILLAIVLIAGEALGATGFLLGAVMASLELALITYIWPDLTWQQQISLFAVLASMIRLATSSLVATLGCVSLVLWISVFRFFALCLAIFL